MARLEDENRASHYERQPTVGSNDHHPSAVTRFVRADCENSRAEQRGEYAQANNPQENVNIDVREEHVKHHELMYLDQRVQWRAIEMPVKKIQRIEHCKLDVIIKRDTANYRVYPIWVLAVSETPRDMVKQGEYEIRIVLKGREASVAAEQMPKNDQEHCSHY